MPSANILYDHDTGIEITFYKPHGSATGHENVVIDYIRALDNKQVPWISSAGMREIEFDMQVEAVNTATMERTMDYFRRSGKHLLLFVPSLYFASEIVIQDVNLVEEIGTTQTYAVSAYCYGMEGISILANNSNVQTNVSYSADASSLGGTVATLAIEGDYVKLNSIPLDDIYLEAEYYTMWVRAKAVYDALEDAALEISDDTSGTLAIDTRAFNDTAYEWRAMEVIILSTSEGHNIDFVVEKYTSATNTISVDAIAFVRGSGNITV